MSVTSQLRALQQYREYLLDRYSNFPQGRYVSVIVIRRTESETIFRTEGSGEGLSKEVVIAGTDEQHSEAIRRVVISKRKQTAVERRVGRELLREHKMLKMVLHKNEKKEYPCSLNTNHPCAQCIDCMLYGYAVGGGGAQKSRVMTDDAFSIGAVAQVTSKRTFNATFDNGTMRSPINGNASTSINEDEYVLPGTHFLDIETLKDVTIGELQYVIGNILRSTRYGAMSSRLGRVHNELAALIFSDTEIFSNLELTQHVYSQLRINQKEANQKEANQKGKELELPLPNKAVLGCVNTAIDTLLNRVVGRLPVVVRGEALERVIEETISLYRNEQDVKALLEEIEQGYKPEDKGK